jgi:hypothetical protein
MKMALFFAVALIVYPVVWVFTKLMRRQFPDRGYIFSVIGAMMPVLISVIFYVSLVIYANGVIDSRFIAAVVAGLPFLVISIPAAFHASR